MIFVIDTNIETLAIKESLKLKIPIVAIIDTNSDPEGINYPIPGNDDARRSISLYCEVIKSTIIDAQKNIKDNSNEEIKTNVEKRKSVASNIDKKNETVEKNKTLKEKKVNKIKAK